jgi:hypothetical protein
LPKGAGALAIETATPKCRLVYEQLFGER